MGKLTSEQARELSKKRKSHRGGAPTKLEIVVREAVISDKKAEAEICLAKMLAISDNPYVSPETRLNAAVKYYEFVEGRATQRTELSGKMEFTDWRERAIAEQGEEAGKAYIAEIEALAQKGEK